MSLAALMHEAAAAYDAGDFERAEPLLLQIVGLNARDADAWHVLAIIALRAGRASEAAERALRAHRLDRRNPLYLNTLGVAQAEAQEMDQAVSAFKRALRERPTHAQAHYNLGKAYEPQTKQSQFRLFYDRKNGRIIFSEGVRKTVVSAVTSKSAAKSPALPGTDAPKPAEKAKAAGAAGAAGGDDLFQGFGFGQ